MAAHDLPMLQEPSTFLTRQDSASKGQWSHDVLHVVQSGTIDEIREKLFEGLLNCPDSLLSQSMKNEHGLRTPLMAAAASGNFALFSAVMHAVDRAINKTADRKLSVLKLERKQLMIKDNGGMTLTMVAAQSGLVPIIRAVLARITSAQDHDRLLDSDYSGNTVLMHAAGAGTSGTFDAFLGAIEGAFSEEEVEEQLRERSGNGWNILMHAARCGDQLGVTAVINACKINMFPSKVRSLVEEVDGNGMTFLMHAASCFKHRTPPDARARFRATTTPIRHNTSPPQTSLPVTGDPSVSGVTTRAHVAPRSGRFHGLAEEDNVEHGGGVSPTTQANIGDNLKVSDDTRYYEISRGRAARIHPSDVSVMGDGDGFDDQAAALLQRGKGALDPSLVVLKTAWATVEGLLWKEQIRKQLKMADTWGRNLLIHAVRSGRTHVFEAVFNAMREHLLDPETDRLMDVDKEDNNQSIMEDALDVAPREMVSLVAKRDQELKKAIAQEERASTIQAKMQSFIPGKLIVIFQLLLPETGGGSGALILLLLLTAIAPMLTWASDLVSRDKPPLTKDARHSKIKNLLSAPAIFFWGIGTSDVGKDALGWSSTSSAAALAVATIVIPGLDAFCANQRVEQWFDRGSCQDWRFSKKAHYVWLKERKKARAQKELRERLKLSPGANRHSHKKWAWFGSRQQQGATVPISTPVSSPSERRLDDVKDRPPIGATEEKEAFTADEEKKTGV